MNKSKSQEAFENETRANKPRKVFEFTSSRDLVTAMNAECQLAPYGDGEMRYVFRDKDGVPIFRRERDAKIALAPYKFQRLDKNGEPDGKPIPGIKVWTDSPWRIEYSAVVFNPKIDAVPKDELNLFGGWGVTPAPGSWRLMKKHLLFNVCRGKRSHYKYLLQWMSQMFCEPEFKSGVCVVLRGPEGVGKSKLGQWLKVIVSRRHSTTTSNPDHAVGKFNTLIRYKILVVIEEAPITGDKRNTFADLITNIDGAVEGKGKDAKDGENYSRFMILLNGDWAVPVLAGDRRYVIYDVGADHKEDKDYFIAIDEEMANGGAAAMLHDLLAMNVKMRDMPKPPMTEAKHEQILLSMKPEIEWLYDVLKNGEFASVENGGVAWPSQGGEVAKDDVVASFRDVVPGRNGRPATSNKAGLFLTKWIPDLETTRPTGPFGQRPWHYKLPPLETAREAFRKVYPTFKFQNVQPEAAEATPQSSSEPEPASAVTPSSVTNLAEERKKRGHG